jgi:hypothetical protein
MKLAIVAISVICAGVLTGCGALEKAVNSSNFAGNLSASPQKEGSVILVDARICDTSGCYTAWNVVDSDGDGVSDADELVAGTNPFDPQSRPTLKVVAELEAKQQLPSFEAGLGTFVVFPPELQTMKEKNQQNPLGDLAFPIERGDSLSRLGISDELLNKYNIDVTSDGLTIGPLSKPDDSGLTEQRVGGVKLSLISGDKEPQDCCFPLLPIEPNAKKEYFTDGSTKTTFSDGSYTTEFRDGSGAYQDKYNNFITTWYVNPDADQVTDKPTPEQEKATLRLRGAVSKTLNNWNAPDPSDAEHRNPRDLIILVDPDYQYGTALIYEVPRVTGAQPEARPDLPNPGAPANPDDFKGSCVVGCP